MLRNRFRSSGAFIDYAPERDRLLVRIEELSAEKQKQAPEEHRRRRAAFLSDRDSQMAQEFLNKKSNPHSFRSDSALKEEIGKRHDLGRSASIEAINRGLKSLKA